MTNAISATNFEVFPLDPLPDMPEFESLINLWDVTRGDALMPEWRDFLFDDLTPWIGRLAISEFDGEELHVGLFGGAFVNLFGQEMTGKPFFATLLPAEREIFRNHFMKIIEGPCIGRYKGEFSLYGRDPESISVIELPMAKKSSDVSYILHALAVM